MKLIDGTKLSAGVHRFPFEYVLPHDLPSSMEGVHGNIRYTISFVFTDPFFAENRFQFPFTIVKFLNFADNPFIRVSLRVFA